MWNFTALIWLHLMVTSVRIQDAWVEWMLFSIRAFMNGKTVKYPCHTTFDCNSCGLPPIQEACCRPDVGKVSTQFLPARLLPWREVCNTYLQVIQGFKKKKNNVKFGTFAKVICDFCQGKGYAMKGYFWVLQCPCKQIWSSAASFACLFCKSQII